jgi:hypothetical protein
MLKKLPKSNVHAKVLIKKIPNIIEFQMQSAVDDILGDANEDTAYMHNSHLYDKNCHICKEQNQQLLAEKKRQERLDAKLAEKVF